jgi:hypothetical protein
MTEQGLAGEFGQVDAQRQIQTGRRAWFISHNFPLQIENYLVRCDDDRIRRWPINRKSPSIGHAKFTVIRKGIKRVFWSNQISATGTEEPTHETARAPRLARSQTTNGKSLRTNSINCQKPRTFSRAMIDSSPFHRT